MSIYFWRYYCIIGHSLGIFKEADLYNNAEVHRDPDQHVLGGSNQQAAAEPTLLFELEQRTEKPEKLIMSVSFTYSKRTLTFCCCKIRVTNVFGSNWHF